MQIGKHEIKNKIFLAPMAGITDQPFRRLCSQLGAGLTFSEMMSANPDVWHTEKSRLRLSHHPDIGINAVQIAGSDPDEMAKAAKANVDYGADIIDINMGCPAKKVNKKMAGSALLREPKLVEKILKSVVNAVNVPVTLKIRTGWDLENKNCLQIAKIAEDVGISALTIHGRTRSCLFKGKAEYDSIKMVKQSVLIPIIANGDIDSPEKAQFVLDYTGADAVMVGRGSFGNPWIFKEMKTFLENGKRSSELSIYEKGQVMLRHISELYSFYGEDKGYRIARKHIGWYADKLTPNSNFKCTFNTLNSAKAQFEALEDFVKLIR